MDPITYYFNTVAKGSSFYNIYTSRKRVFSLESVDGLVLWLNPTEYLYSDGSAAIDGTNYLYIPNNSDIAAGDRNWTWCGWFYVNALGPSLQTLFSKYGGGGTEYLLQVNNSYYNIVIPGVVSQNIGLGTSRASEWIFISFRYNSSTDIIDLKIGSASYSWSCTGITPTSESFRLGAYSTRNDVMNGKIDSMGRWNRYLSDGELLWLKNGKVYNDLTDSIKSDLVLWWDFDEASGIRYDAHSSNNLLEDVSVAGAEGSLAGLASTYDCAKEWKGKTDVTKYISQNTFSCRPLYVATGNMGSTEIRFDGVDDTMAGTFSLPNQITVYSVIKQTNWTNGTYILDGTSANNHALIQTGINTGDLGISCGTLLTGCTGLGTGTYGIVTTIFTSNSGYLQVNNFNYVTGNVGNVTLANLTLGSKGGGTKFSKFNIAELLIYSGIHDTSTRAVIKNSLAKTWSITI